MKTIFEGKTKKGTSILVRYPDKSDALMMCDFINELSLENTYIRFQGERINLRDEEKYLKLELRKIKEKKGIYLIASSQGVMIGSSSISMLTLAESHVGEFGIVIRKEFRGEGLGKILMELTLKEAKKKIKALEKVVLGCFANNQVALELYKKFGFKEFGKLPNGLKYKGEFIDHIYMYKDI